MGVTRSVWRDSYDPNNDRQDADRNVPRVVRGGSFGYGRRGVRAACRYLDLPDGRGGGRGFRVVLSPFRS